MNESEQTALRQRYQQAIDRFIERIRDDVNVIAVIVGGSVAYDVIWEKSDVDLTVVVRDQPLKSGYFCLEEDGIYMSVAIIPRSRLKRGMEKAIGGSFMQSYLANSIVVYSTDESLVEFFEEARTIGEDDAALSALILANELIAVMHKAQKWLTVRQDTAYAQYFLLKTAEIIAHMELCIRSIPTSRSAIQKALKLNPEVMEVFYREPMNHLLSVTELQTRLERLEGYIQEKMDFFQKPVIAYLADGEIKTVAMIAQQLHTESPYVIDALNYLAEHGRIERASQLIKLTPKSRLSVEEFGFVYFPQ
jgi:uncharacterized protein